MTTVARMAEIAALVGDPGRAAMLQALMDGRALTASELARHAGVTPQTASGHLARLLDAGLLGVSAQGRHRYYRLGSATIAGMLEGLMQVAAVAPPGRRALQVGPRDERLRAARTCYDHFAGRLGVGLAAALVARDCLTLDHEAGMLTHQGLALLERLGVFSQAPSGAMPEPAAHRFCRPCLDWSERRLHIAGRVGAALTRWSFDRGWVRRLDGTRAVSVTPAGVRGFRDTFGLRLEEPDDPSVSAREFR